MSGPPFAAAAAPTAFDFTMAHVNRPIVGPAMKWDGKMPSTTHHGPPLPPDRCLARCNDNTLLVLNEIDHSDPALRAVGHAHVAVAQELCVRQCTQASAARVAQTLSLSTDLASSMLSR